MDSAIENVAKETPNEPQLTPLHSHSTLLRVFQSTLRPANLTLIRPVRFSALVGNALHKMQAISSNKRVNQSRLHAISTVGGTLCGQWPPPATTSMCCSHTSVDALAGVGRLISVRPPLHWMFHRWHKADNGILSRQDRDFYSGWQCTPSWRAISSNE